MKVCRKCGKATARNLCPRCGRTLWKSAYSIQYTPKETRDYEDKVALYSNKARKEAGVGILTGAVSLTIRAFFAIPESRKKLKEGDCHTQRPDLDNVLKSVKDGMNKVVYYDDSLIWNVTASKYWGEPRVEVILEDEQ